MEENPDQAVRALANLQATYAAQKRELVPTHLRNLRSLLTPEARRAILPTILAPGADHHDLDDAIKGAVHEMWVGWTWCPENPHLAEGIGMPISLCAV